MATFSLDIETTNLDPFKGSIICVSWCKEDLIPHCRMWTPALKAYLSGLLGNPKNTSITQYGTFDYTYLAKEGLIVRAKTEDTMVASHVVESNQSARLADLVNRYLVQEILTEAGINIQIDFGWKKTGPEKWLDENKRWFKKAYGRNPHMGDVPKKMLVEYSKKDALYTLLVWFAMRDFIEKSMRFSYNLDIAMIPIVVGMKLRGMPVDLALCRQRVKELRRKQRAFLTKYQIDKVGPKALTNIIFPSLDIKLKYKTPKDNWRFDEKTLRRYQIQNPEAAKPIEEVIQYRKDKQADSTYYSGYINTSFRGKIFPTFNLTAAKTGRFSSSNPNLQNVKKKGSERAVFLVRPNFINIHWDYDQIELRLLAHYSNEKRLLEVFETGTDPHTRTADLMDIDVRSAKAFLSGRYRGQKPRFIGKQLNYAYWYGMGIDAFCLDLGIPRQKGVELFERYRSAYPDAVRWSKNLIRDAKFVGFVKDIFGRRYYPDDRYSYYKLVNYLIQGTAAQVIKIGMLRTQKVLHRTKRNITIVRELPQSIMHGIQLLTVHDEIGIEFPDDRTTVEIMLPKITEALTISNIFKLPLTVSSKWTRTNWRELAKTQETPIPWK